MVPAAVFVVVILGSSSAAWAHVSLVSSEPQNVSTVAGPVDEIRLTFSAQADPVADEFSLVSSSGAEVPIDSVTNDGGEVLVVSLAEAPPVGRTRLTWAIRSGDSHTMTGSVSFTVTEPSPGAVGVPDTSAVVGADQAVDAALEGNPETETDWSATGSAPSRTLADHLATAARWLVYGAAFICIGGLAYLGFVHRGTPAECRRLVFYARRAAVVVVAASVAEWLAEVVAYSRGAVWDLVSPSAWNDLLGTGFAKGTALRLVGAGLVLVFTRNEVDRWDSGGDWPEDPLDRILDDPVAQGGVAVVDRAPALARARVEASAGALIGAALLVISEAFIGHTATVTPRLAVLVSDAGHLVAGAAWSSGALMLAVTLTSRRRSGRPLDARLLATRFSVMATWCLVLVAVTGTAMAWSILGGPSALFSTEFGRVLLLKLVLVAGLVAVGGYNHLRLVPGLEAGDHDVEGRFASTITVEVALFTAVLAVTALLVTASPT